MRKKALLTLLTGFILAALVLSCAACSTLENNLRIEDDIVSRFGDGISVISSNAAPSDATEFKDVERVKMRVNVDARVGGYHLTGVYLPAGETLTVNVSSEISQAGYRLRLNSFVNDRTNSTPIDSTEKKISSEKGGIVELWVPASATSDNSFDVIIEGGIVMPYYRMGRDTEERIYAGDGKYAILDGENIRFYVPTDLLFDSEGNCTVEDLYNTLLWWQSAVTFLNKATDMVSLKSNYSIRVVVGDFGTAPTLDDATGLISIDRSYFLNALDFENLKVGKSWELLYKICERKVKLSSGFEGVFALDMIVDILANIDYVMMTNSGYNSTSSWLNNAYSCLEKTIELLSLPESERDENYSQNVMRAFFINILHSFGVDKTLDILIEYSHASKESENGEMTIDEFALSMSKILQRDMTFYFEMFKRGLSQDMGLSQETIDKMKGKQIYIPVQSKYAVGGNNEFYDLGYTVPMGESTAFDFQNSIISFVDGWSVYKVESDSTRWTLENGIFYYNPSTSKLVDDYTLYLRNGEYSAVLYGRINVNISTAVYKVYEGWTFSNMSTALEDAIASYSKRKPDHVGSIDYAGINRYEEDAEQDSDDNTYVFTVTDGCMSVPESGNYTIYLKNTGLCQVEFGVQKYMFDMFANSLPVTDYTDYLSYNIELDSNKTYEFKIYMLSTKGEGNTMLGIRYNDGDDKTIRDVDDSYLIYRGLSKDDIVEYQPPSIYPDGYTETDEFYQSYDINEKNFVQYPQAVVTSGLNQAFDSLSTSYYVANDKKNEYVFVMDLGTSKRTEYFSFIVKESMAGAKVSIFSADKNASDKYKEVAVDGGEYALETGVNVINYTPVTARYVKIVISADEAFECAFTDFKTGQHFEKSTIVANTSSSLSYMGGWNNVFGYVSINGSVSQSADNNSVISFTAVCRQICLYGVKDSIYGKMDVYVDGSHYTTIDLYNATPVTNALIFAIDFDTTREHSIKIMPAEKGDVINLDYISYIPETEEEINANTDSLLYALIIPAVIAVALIGAAVADVVKKRKSRRL